MSLTCLRLQTSRILCLLLVVGFGARVTAAGAYLPPASEEYELRTIPEKGYGKLDGHGKLFFQRFYENMFSTEVATLAYFPHGQDLGVFLQRNVTAMNVFLAAEIRRPRTVQTFLSKYLQRFLVENLTEMPATAITRKDIDDGLGVAEERHHGARWAAKCAWRKARIQRYAPSRPLVVVTGDDWTVDVNVLTNRGAVEHWLIKGRMTPMQIDSFLCQPKEPDGTFQPEIMVN